MNLKNSHRNFNSPNPICLIIPQKKLWLATPIWILAVCFFQIKIFHFPQGNIQSNGQFCRWKPALWQVKKVEEKKIDHSSIEISFFICKSAIHLHLRKRLSWCKTAILLNKIQILSYLKISLLEHCFHSSHVFFSNKGALRRPMTHEDQSHPVHPPVGLDQLNPP